MEQKDINESVEVVETQTESSIGETQVAYSLKDFFKMVGRHWIALVLGGLLGLAGGVGYGRYIQKPKYQATADIYVLNNDVSNNQQEVITYATNMARIASKYMTQTEVKEEACRLLAGTSTSEDYISENKYAEYVGAKDGQVIYNTTGLGKQYTVTLEQNYTNNTSIFIHVTATAKTADLSIDICNAVVAATKKLSDQGSSKIASQLKGYITPMAPANSATNVATKTVVLAFVGVLLGLVVGAGYGILRDLLNTRVSTKKELEIITGIKVIGMIPNYIERKVEESTLELDDAEIKDNMAKEGK